MGSMSNAGAVDAPRIVQTDGCQCSTSLTLEPGASIAPHTSPRSLTPNAHDASTRLRLNGDCGEGNCFSAVGRAAKNPAVSSLGDSAGTYPPPQLLRVRLPLAHCAVQYAALRSIAVIDRLTALTSTKSLRERGAFHGKAGIPVGTCASETMSKARGCQSPSQSSACTPTAMGLRLLESPTNTLQSQASAGAVEEMGPVKNPVVHAVALQSYEYAAPAAPAATPNSLMSFAHVLVAPAGTGSL